MERNLRKKSFGRLIGATILLIAYFVALLVYNFYYITQLNGYFKALNMDPDMISQINAARVTANVTYMWYEIIFAGIGALLILFEATSIIKLLKTYENIAFKDLLTGCASREAMEAFFDMTEKKKKVAKLTYFLFDLNYLKQLNEEYSREKGDEFLVKISKILKNVFKNTPVYRISGEEFAVIYTGDEDPQNFIDAIRDHVDSFNWKNNDTDIALSFAKGYVTDSYAYDDKKYRITLYQKAASAVHEDESMFKRILPGTKRTDIKEKEIRIRQLEENK